VSDLYRLVYASKNLLQGSDAEIAQAVSQILDASQRNNARVGVTGALMFNAGAFAQVLEGPQQGVESTFERIQCDPRHGDVTVLQCGSAESRSFTNWSMAFVGQSDAGRARWNGIAAASGFDLTRLDGDAVFAMLHGLVLDEEGLSPLASAPPELARTAEKPSSPMDVERVCAELPQLGQAPQATHVREVVPATERSGARPATKEQAAHAAKPDAALSILRAALAQERQFTTELRNELDEVRIALALQQEQSEAISQERNLWAERAQLLATVISNDATVLLGKAQGVNAETGAADHPSRSSASIRVVA